MTDRIARAAALAALIGSAAALAATTLPAGWKLTEDEARSYAFDAVVGGHLNHWNLKDGWTATPADARAALLRGGLEWARAYTATPAFAQAYAARRADAKPEPHSSGMTIEQELAAERAKQRQELEDLKAQIKQMPADQQQAMKDMAAMMEQQHKQMAADPQMQAMLREGKQAERAERAMLDKESMEYWQKDWPADPKLLIARRLRAFLAACGDVDFSAKLIRDPQSGKRLFAETRYEMKSAEWKTCYRAGKAPVEAARAFAQEWLKALPAG